ncbi:MAG: PAS domain S-box protein, partial [Nitrospiraceae bacterium]
MISTSNLSVLDLLRKRVADLARELAERDGVLHERTRHLRVAQSLAHLGSWDWEIESGEVRCSNEVYRIFGRDPGLHHMTFETFVSALYPDDHDRVVTAINDALGGKAPLDLEYKIVRPKGDVRTIHCCGEVLRDDNGTPCRMSGSVLDITDRKRMEEAVRESEDRYRTLVELSPSGVFVFCEGRTVYV